MGVYEGKADRKTVIIKVSGKLGFMVINKGFKIDDIYRNIVGIIFQMYSR